MNLKEYIQGKRHGKEANRLEREAMSDPFLQDAIDGYDSVAGDHLSAIKKLEKKVAPKPSRKVRPVWIWAAAALLVLLIGIPFLLRQPALNEEMIIATNESGKVDSEMTTPENDSVLMTIHRAVETEKKALSKYHISEVKRNDEVKGEDKEKRIDDVTVLTTPGEEAPVEQENQLVETSVNRNPLKQPRILDRSIQEQLQGSVAGIAVASENEQSAAENIRIRGISTSNQSDRKLVQGRLTDETGDPLIGANVNLQNSTVGTITDTEGNFTIDVPKETQGTLLASYIGMENREIPLDEHIGTIVLKADTDLLSEVVVIGYGTQRKKVDTGAVTKQTEVIPTFGEAEFIRYFEENYDKHICEEQAVAFVVTFFIDSNGHPGNIHIKENNCPAMVTEIKRLLLGSPLWSDVDREVTLKIK